MTTHFVPRALFLLFAGSCFLCGRSAHAQDAVKVEKLPPVVKYETFDPKNRPANMPRLSGKEAADCRSEFSVGCQVGVEVTEDNEAGNQHAVTVKVETITVTTTLTITLWLPAKPPAPLKAHEEGHRKIAESFYKDAEKIARELAAKQIGRSFAGRGKTTATAANAAMNHAISEISGGYMAATQIPSAKVNDLFDEITNHGEKKIPVDEAIQQAMEEYGKIAKPYDGH